MKTRLALAAAIWCLGALSASAAPCVTLPVAVYELAVFSCNVGGITFSNVQVNVTTSNGGSVTLGNFTPFTDVVGGIAELGLTLDYTAQAPAANSTADITWSYNVVGVPFIVDAFLALSGTTTASGQAQMSEILSNGITLGLNAPGSIQRTFSATASLFVSSDQVNFVGAAGGTSTTNSLTNAFSTSLVPQVPEPESYAMLLAGLGLMGFVARRKKQNAA